jgi:membrane fusion protein (multidrug efflux system)
VTIEVNAPRKETASNAAVARAGRTSWIRPIGIALMAIVVVGVIVGWFLSTRNRETTQDAYVDGNVVAVTSQVSGVVTAIDADDTDYVGAGRELVRLDDTDAQLALAQAEAELARTVRQVRQLNANAGAARANLLLRSIELARAQADYARRQRLLADGGVSGEEARHARDAVRSATAALAAARQQLNGSTALVDHASLATNPAVLAAASRVRDAWVALNRTAIPAPVAGMVTKRSVQLGQKINPGVVLMSVVPLDHLWVDANFRESQLRHIRIGQPVTLVSDVYGSDVVYHGTVIGQQAGTGSAFSLLPAQNATGNWIKVVQRVPVRIALDPREIARHPLQLGLSMDVTVSTRARRGHRLVTVGSPDHGYHTDVFAHPLASADELVARIIAANQ